MREAILSLLAIGPAHGYELKQALEEHFGPAWPPINIGQVYVTLQRLERDQLIAGTDVAQPGRPNKTVYQITGAGERELHDWFAAPAAPPRLRDDFVSRVILAQATGMADPLQLIDRQRAAYLQALRGLQRMEAQGAVAPLPGLLIEGASLHIEADLKWLDRCEEHFTKG